MDNIRNRFPPGHLEFMTELFGILSRDDARPKKRGRPREVALNFFLFELYSRLLLQDWGNEDAHHEVHLDKHLEYTALIADFVSGIRDVPRFWVDDSISYRGGVRIKIMRILARKRVEIYGDVFPRVLENYDQIAELARKSLESPADILPRFFKYIKHRCERATDPRSKKILKAIATDYFSC